MILRIPWHALNVGTPFLSDLSVARGRQRLSELVGRSILRRGGPQALLSETRWPTWTLSSRQESTLPICLPELPAVGLGWGTQIA